MTIFELERNKYEILMVFSQCDTTEFQFPIFCTVRIFVWFPENPNTSSR